MRSIFGLLALLILAFNTAATEPQQDLRKVITAI